tara:strand:+ start:193 stop:3489 length:3297 start_codon:yes stop_codon:yes gene_type:complete
MDTRLVVYRKETSGASSVTPFELDLDKAPNVRINYNWLDIKEPDNKKSNFSQTIKIPFTNRNNTFFENWFDVNLDSLVYNTKTKFKAVVLVDSVPQLDGYVQLKSIYLNARKYEVVVFGDTANFFADIKGAKLREAFVDADGVIDRQLDHLNTLANIKGSWDAGLTTVTSVTDNDIMYPIIDYGHTDFPLCDSMFWNPTYLNPLNDNMGNFATFQENANYYGLIQSGNLKPAIRIQRLLKIIAAKAGYSITSTFLGLSGDTQDKTTFFGKQFMTLAPQHERVRTKVYNGFLATMGTAITDGSVSYNDNAFMFTGLQFNTESYDDNNLFSNETIYPDAGITPNISASYDPDNPSSIPVGELTIQVNLNITTPTSITANGSSTPVTGYTLMWEYTNSQYFNPSGIFSTAEGVPSGTNIEYQCVFTIPATDVVNQNNALTLHIVPNINTQMLDSDTFSVTINSGTIQTINNGQGMFNNGGVNAEVTMAENMPDITQSDFVKDLCSRYNLVILSDPNDSTKLIVEPYQDYIGSGAIQYWTDKLDMSKEQTIKTTNELQNKQLLYTDLEGKDYLNKSYTNKYGRVFGSLEQLNRNDFAKGNFNTFSIYKPFIAQGIGHWQDNLQGMSPNEQAAIAFNFETTDDGIRQPITDGKPMLFYYGGDTITLADLNDQWGNDYDFSIITGIYTTLGNTEVLSLDEQFPLCLPYNMDTIGSGITSSTKMLHWEYYKPQFVSGFTFNIFGDTVTNHGYYLDYWSQYINEIYSDEARIMECNLNLNEDDIFNFSFKNPIYIKNTLWRVLSIDNYVVGGKETTKVKLLKAITKLNYDCDVIPSTYNVNGTITFINPATGASADVTNECCEDLNENWTFVQTNDSTGVGTCYHNSNTYTSTTVLDNTSTTTTTGVLQADTPNMLMMPMLQVQNTITRTISRGGQVNGQESIMFLECITNGTTAENLRQKNVNDRILMIPRNTMAYINVELSGTIIGGTTGFIGKVGFFEYYSVLTNLGGRQGHSGTTGGTTSKSVKDSDFPLPTVNITTYDSTGGYLKLSVTHSGDNITNWFAKVRVLIQPVGNPKSITTIGVTAVYQNGTGILFQDNGMLLWN